MPFLSAALVAVAVIASRSFNAWLGGQRDAGEKAEAALSALGALSKSVADIERAIELLGKRVADVEKVNVMRRAV